MAIDLLAIEEPVVAIATTKTMSNNVWKKGFGWAHEDWMAACHSALLQTCPAATLQLAESDSALRLAM